MRAGLCCVAIAAAVVPCAAQETMCLLGSTNPRNIHLSAMPFALHFSSAQITGYEQLRGGLASDSAGALYAIDGFNDNQPDRLFRFDRHTGAGAVIGSTGYNWASITMAVNPVNGVLYLIGDGRLYSIDMATGSAAFIAEVTATSQVDTITGLAFGPGGQAIVIDNPSTALFQLDIATGVATFIANVTNWTGHYADIAFDSTGTLWGVQQSGSLFKFNLSTGAAVWSGGNGVFWGLAFVGDSSCWPDCNSSGALTVADFACFQARFVIGDWYADCNFDSQLNIADFGCFQTKYAAGCP